MNKSIRHLSRAEVGCRLSLLIEARDALLKAYKGIRLARAGAADRATFRAIHALRSAIHYTEGVLATKDAEASKTHQETV